MENFFRLPHYIPLQSYKPFLKFEVMDIDNLLSTFEQRLRLQRYSEASIRNYKSAVGFFLQLASKKIQPKSIRILPIYPNLLSKVR